MECGKCLGSDCRGFPGYQDPECPVHGSNPKICRCIGKEKRKVRKVMKSLRAEVVICTKCGGKMYETAVKAQTRKK